MTRVFLSLLALMLSITMSGSAAATPANGDDLIERAFFFGFPVYEMMRVRGNSRAPVNTIGLRSMLTGPKDRAITAPNNDTLYASAWLDLAAGPITLDVPALPERYYSVHLMDLFTDAFAIPGTRADGGQGGRFLIVGPDWKGDAERGIRVLRAPTNDVWMIIRILVDGPDDLPSAVAAQQQFQLSQAAPARPFEPPTPTMPTAEVFLAVVNAALARSAVPAQHRDRLARLASVGLGPGAPAWNELSAEVRVRWQQLMQNSREALRHGFATAGTRRNGWFHPRPGLGRFREDDAYRAAVALGGLAALPEEEALYLNSDTDAAGKPFDGNRTYRFIVPKEIPIAAFWSLTLYEPDGTGRWFLYDNEIARYSIGNRSKGVVRAPDGTIRVAIQNTRPDDPLVNWLPAPPGLFRLSFRAYLPRPEFRDGRFLLPPVNEKPVKE